MSAKKKALAERDLVLTVFAHYRTYHPRSFRTPVPASKEWRKIVSRLQEGYTVDDLCEAIDGCHRSPFHCGENDRGLVYQSLELIMRDGSHVDQFLRLYQAAGRPVVSETVQRTLRAAEALVQRLAEKSECCERERARSDDKHE